MVLKFILRLLTKERADNSIKTSPETDWCFHSDIEVPYVWVVQWISTKSPDWRGIEITRMTSMTKPVINISKKTVLVTNRLGSRAVKFSGEITVRKRRLNIYDFQGFTISQWNELTSNRKVQ